MGVTRGAVANWECSLGTLPASSRLALLAQVTGVCFEWLATGRGPEAYCTGAGDVPALDAELVHERDERRLLMAYRLAGNQTRRLLLNLVEAQFAAVQGKRNA